MLSNIVDRSDKVTEFHLGLKMQLVQNSESNEMYYAHINRIFRIFMAEV